MSSEIKKGIFRVCDLVKLDESKHVYFASDGIPMEVESIERTPDGTTNMLCKWESENGVQRHLFDSRLLRMMCRITEEDISNFSV